MKLKQLMLLFGLAVVGFVAAPQVASALTFQQSPEGPITIAPPDDEINAISAGDVNSDGKEDLVVTGPYKGIYVFLADSDGQGFTPAVGSPYGTDSAATNGHTNIQIASMNTGNSRDLLVATNTYPNSYETYLGNYSGSYGATPNYTLAIPDFSHVPAGMLSTSMTDLNFDTYPDLIVGTNEHAFRVALGSSTGQYTWAPGSPVTIPTPTNSVHENFFSTAIGDWNGNGLADVAVAGYDVMTESQIAIYTANGNGVGAFTPTGAAVHTQNAPELIENIATIDLNGDQYDDLVFTSRNPDTIKTLIGSPTGLIPNPAEDSTMNLGSSTFPTNIAIGDFNSDGRQDFSNGLWATGRFVIGMNAGNGNIAADPDSPFSFSAIGEKEFRPNQVVSGDFNGDGTDDVAGQSTNYLPDSIGRGIEVMINKPVPVVDPASLDFPVTPVNGTSAPLTINVRNDGGPDLNFISFLVPGGDDQFDYDKTDCPPSLPSGQDCDVVVRFQPDQYGTPTANLLISFAGGVDSISIPLSGRTPAKAEPDTDTVEFGDATSGAESKTEYVQYNSIGGEAVELGTPVITGPDAADFTVEDEDCSAAPIPSGSSCTVQVKFTPPADTGGFREAYLGFPDSNDPNLSDVALEGHARRAQYSVTPTSFDFGVAKIGPEPRTPKVFTLISTGDAAVSFSKVEISGTDADSFRVTANTCPETIDAMDGTCTFSVIFDPAYGSATTRNATLQVDAFSSVNPGPTTIALTGTATSDPLPPVGEPKLTLKLKSPGKIKRGKTLVVTAVVKNTGDAPAKPLTIKATAPKKFVKAPNAIKVPTLAPGQTITKKLKIKVKKTAKKGKKLKVKITATSGSAKKAATRTVKVR